MTARLIAAWEESEVNEECPGIVRGVQRGPPEVKGHVGIEEDVPEVVEDRDAVRRQCQRVDGGHGDGVGVVDDLAEVGGGSGVGVREHVADEAARGVDARRQCDLGALPHVDVGVHHLGHAVPVAPHVRVASRHDAAGPRAHVPDVPRGAHADEHVLDGPLQLGQQHLAGAVLGDARDLLTVDADQRESDPLNEYVMHFRVHEDVVDVQLHAVHVGAVRVADLEDRLVVHDALGRVRAREVGTGRREDFDDGLQVQVGELEGQVVVLGELDRDEALAEGNRHARDGQAHIVVEPNVTTDLSAVFPPRVIGPALAKGAAPSRAGLDYILRPCERSKGICLDKCIVLTRPHQHLVVEHFSEEFLCFLESRTGLVEACDHVIAC